MKKIIITLILFFLTSLFLDVYLFIYGKSIVNYKFIYPVDLGTGSRLSNKHNTEIMYFTDQDGFRIFSEGCVMEGSDFEISNILEYGFNSKQMYILVDDTTKSKFLFWVNPNQYKYTFSYIKLGSDELMSISKNDFYVISLNGDYDFVYYLYGIRNIIFFIILILLFFIIYKNIPW